MFFWQSIIVAFFGLYSLSGFVIGVKKRNNPFGLSRWFLPIGAFVWTDAVIFGAFFTLVSTFCLLLGKWILFLLILSIFWTIRSFGEQVYWFLEQFAQVHKNAPHTLWPHKWFGGHESWIIMQITWQCVSAISIISSVWLFYKFLVY